LWLTLKWGTNLHGGGTEAHDLVTAPGYIEDGSNLVTKAMNGWSDPEPAWWLNLMAHPDDAPRCDLVSPMTHPPFATPMVTLPWA
jgi:hypothetical protein